MPCKCNIPFFPPNTCSAPPGLPWTLLEHGCPRFALSSCQASLSVQASSAFCAPEPPPNPAAVRRDIPQYAAHSYQSHQMLPMPSCAVMSAYGPSSTPLSPCPSSCTSPCPSPCLSPVFVSAGSGQNSPSRRKRSINPQSEENFLRALEAVRFGGIGFCKAARMYGVNNRTLWLEYKKRGYPVTRPSLKARVKQILPTSMLPPVSNQMEPPPNVAATSIMGPPPPATHMQVGGFLDSHHVEFVHPQGPAATSRQRSQQDNTGNLSNASSNTHHDVNSSYNQLWKTRKKSGMKHVVL